ncbi:MAG: hypothetical protein WCB05_21980 [Candidatus Sulfotelmatobacter sp.]
MAANRHPGITMHKISFGGGFVGFLFAAGSSLIFVLGFPTCGISWPSPSRSESESRYS